MRPILLAAIIAGLPTLAFAAEPAGKKLKNTSDTKSPGKPCKEYGEGFVKLEGSSTCVKVGGYVRYQTGVRR